MRHTRETAKRQWHLWVALAFVAAVAFCGNPDPAIPMSITNEAEE